MYLGEHIFLLGYLSIPLLSLHEDKRALLSEAEVWQRGFPSSPDPISPPEYEPATCDEQEAMWGHRHCQVCASSVAAQNGAFWGPGVSIITTS